MLTFKLIQMPPLKWIFFLKMCFQQRDWGVSVQCFERRGRRNTRLHTDEDRIEPHAGAASVKLQSSLPCCRGVNLLQLSRNNAGAQAAALFSSTSPSPQNKAPPADWQALCYLRLADGEGRLLPVSQWAAAARGGGRQPTLPLFDPSSLITSVASSGIIPRLSPAAP